MRARFGFALISLAAIAGITVLAFRRPPEKAPAKLKRSLAVEMAELGLLDLPLPLERPFVAPAAWKPPTLCLDAGHGAENNEGNTGVFGQKEQDFTKLLSYDVTETLEPTFSIVLSRTDGDRVAYPARLELARARRCDMFVSIHSDVRGESRAVPFGETGRKMSLDWPGFSVLYSDEGDPTAVAARRELARAIARAMTEASFAHYDGDYEGLYARDEVPGVFIDRHEPQKRIFVLRRMPMPSVIVETHNAIDPRDARAWETPTTRAAFAYALGSGLIAFVERAR